MVGQLSAEECSVSHYGPAVEVEGRRSGRQS